MLYGACSFPRHAIIILTDSPPTPVPGIVFQRAVALYRKQKGDFSPQLMAQVSVCTLHRFSDSDIRLVAPVIAVVTKFDSLVERCAQEISESGRYNVDDPELNESAEVLAKSRFEEYYRKPLLSSSHPPKAVVRLRDGK